MIWLGIFALTVGVMFLGPQQPQATVTLQLPEVLKAVEEGRIVEGANNVIKEDPSSRNFYVVSGKLQASEALAEGRENLMPGEEVAFKAEGRILDEEYRVFTQHFDEKPGNTVWTQVLISLLPFVILILLLYFLFIRQLRSAGKGAMSFGKSKAKMLTRDREKVTFKDVAGYEEAKEEVSEMVEFLRDPKKFQKIGARIPKGVLMVGPPGTGKTLLARGIAGEADVPFFSVSGSDFVEMFVGVGAARVRDMFEQGRRNAPCIIFIDEIDAVGRQRGAGLGGGNDEREQTLNSLLVEMDGFEGHEGVIIIAATNRPDVLDNALLRPGRFDRQVMIDLPDLNGREEILKVHAKKIALAEDVDLHVAAKNSSGFSGAVLANLLNEAALIAARRDKSKVDNSDIDEARDKIAYGRERRKLMDDEDRKITAWHEAGHAIVGAVIDDGFLPVHKVTIIPRGQSLGSTMFMPSKDILNQAKRRVLNQICYAMGGRAAEELEMGDITSGASGDIKMSTKLARKMVCDWGMSPLGPLALGDTQDHVFLGREIAREQNYSEQTAQKIDQEIRSIVQTQYERAVKVLNDNKKALDTLAEALLEHETVEGKHVYEILEHGSIRSPIRPVETAKQPRPEEQVGEAAKERRPEELGPEGNAVGAPA